MITRPQLYHLTSQLLSYATRRDDRLRECRNNYGSAMRDAEDATKTQDVNLSRLRGDVELELEEIRKKRLEFTLETKKKEFAELIECEKKIFEAMRELRMTREMLDAVSHLDADEINESLFLPPNTPVRPLKELHGMREDVITRYRTIVEANDAESRTREEELESRAAELRRKKTQIAHDLRKRLTVLRREHEFAMAEIRREFDDEREAIIESLPQIEKYKEAWFNVRDTLSHETLPLPNEGDDAFPTPKRIKKYYSGVVADEEANIAPEEFLERNKHKTEDCSCIFPHCHVSFKALYAFREEENVNDQIIDFLAERYFARYANGEPVLCFSAHVPSKVIFNADKDMLPRPMTEEEQRARTDSMFERYHYDRKATLIFPLNLRNRHWVAIMITNGKLYWYDSLTWLSTAAKKRTVAWYKNCFDVKLVVECNDRKDQDDVVNCGVYTLLRMRRWMEDKAWDNSDRVFSEVTEEEVRRERNEGSLEVMRELLKGRAEGRYPDDVEGGDDGILEIS